MNVVLLTTFLFGALKVMFCQQNEPNFRILAPQVICKTNKDSLMEIPPQITISMQTEGGQKLTYRIQMYFEVLGGYRGQQHALSLWRAVRMMEKKINVKDKLSISDKNQINVNNTELVQGVYYVFKIIGIDENGDESEAQNFTVNYSDGKIKRTNADGSIIPDDITFLMLGSEMAYADLEYKVDADVTFCNPRYDYYFLWEVSNLPEIYKNLIQIPGKTLRIPSVVFKGGETYLITAKLFQSNESRALLENTINVQVKKRGFSAKLFPENVLIGISRPLTLKLYFADFDNSRLKPNIKWKCKSLTDDSDCDSMEEITQYQQTVELYERGSYTITANIQLDATSVTLESNVLVDPDVIVVPFFKNPPTKALQAEEHFEMETTLDGLVPNCFASWTVVNETGYKFFDSSMIPEGLGNVSVTDIEGNFLSELVDFMNSTLSRDILLVVPKKGLFPNWEGLKGNSKYKFRLIMTCPAPISNDQNQTLTRRNVTSFADLIISTNQPPKGKPLEITPQSGVGFKTFFKFSTGIASDEETDYPLKYNFLIEFDGITLSIGEFYENMVVTSQLPYSESQISTKLEICDSREACSIVDGSMISTVPLNADINLNDTIANIRASMLRLEYDKCFRLALIAGVTFKNLNMSTKFANFKNDFTGIIRSEINRLGENPTSSYYISSKEIVAFIRYTKQYFVVINSDDSIDQGLLELLEATESNEKSKQIENDETNKSTRRRKRSISNTNDQMTEKIAQINANLQLFESKIASNNESTSFDGKKRLIEKVQTFMSWLCNEASFTYIILDKSIIKMEIRKTNVNQILRTNMTVIPSSSYKRPAYIQINANLNVNPKNEFCVGKIMFPSDYLSGQLNTGEIFEIIIVEINGNANINVVDISTSTGEYNSIALTVPIEKEIGDFECQVWENQQWSSNICKTTSIKSGYINCRCSKVTYFRAFEKMNTTIATTVGSIMGVTIEPLSTDPSVNVTEALTTKLVVVESNTELLDKTTVLIPTTINSLTSSVMQISMNVTESPSPISVTYTDVLPTSIVDVISNVNDLNTALNVTAAEIVEIITLQPNASTILTTLAASSASSSQELVTNSPKLMLNNTLPSHTTNNYSESILSTIISSFDTNSSVLQKDTLSLNETEKRSYSSSTGYVLAVIFVIAGIFIVVGLFVYNRRKKPNTLAQQLEIISSEVRTSNNAVKYARFHDEETMRGDNIETIFTAQ